MNAFGDLMSSDDSIAPAKSEPTPAPTTAPKKKQAAPKKKQAPPPPDSGNERENARAQIEWAASATLRTELEMENATAFFGRSDRTRAALLEALRARAFHENSQEFRAMRRSISARLKAGANDDVEPHDLDLYKAEVCTKLFDEIDEEVAREIESPTKKVSGPTRYLRAVAKASKLCHTEPIGAVMHHVTQLARSSGVEHDALFFLWVFNGKTPMTVSRVPAKHEWRVHNRYTYTTQIKARFAEFGELCMSMLGRFLYERLAKKFDADGGLPFKQLCQFLYRGENAKSCAERLEVLFGIRFAPDELALVETEFQEAVVAKKAARKPLPTPRKRTEKKASAPKPVQEKKEKKKATPSSTKKRKRVTPEPEPAFESEPVARVAKSSVLGHPISLCPLAEPSDEPLLEEFADVAARELGLIERARAELVPIDAARAKKLFSAPTIEKNTAPAQKTDQIDPKTGATVETTTARSALHAQSSREPGVQRNLLTRTAEDPSTAPSKLLAEVCTLARTFERGDSVDSSTLHDTFERVCTPDKPMSTADALGLCRASGCVEKLIAHTTVRLFERGVLWAPGVSSSESDPEALLKSLASNKEFQAYVARLLVHTSNLLNVDAVLTTTPDELGARLPELVEVPALGETTGNGFDPLQIWAE